MTNIKYSQFHSKIISYVVPVTFAKTKTHKNKQTKPYTMLKFKYRRFVYCDTNMVPGNVFNTTLQNLSKSYCTFTENFWGGRKARGESFINDFDF